MKLHLIPKALRVGLLVGLLDISAACIDAYITYGSSPAKVLTGITGAALGDSSQLPYWLSVMAGMGIHLLIAMSFTFLFFICYPYLKKLIPNSLLLGILYGIFIWTSMRFVILPTLSHIKFTAFDIRKAVKPALILICAIGIPLSLGAKKIFKQEN